MRNPKLLLFIVVLSFVCSLMSCKTTIVEMRNGKPWIIETTGIGSLVISRTERPQPTFIEKQRNESSENGIQLVYIGAICLSVAIAAHLMVAMDGSGIFHRVAEWAAACGIGLTVGGLWVCALAAGWYWILGAIAVVAIAIGLYFVRKKGLKLFAKKG